MKITKREDAISQIMGTVLLLLIGVAIMFLVYSYVLSYPPPNPAPIVDIFGSFQSGNIVLLHAGGERLSLDTTLLVNIGGVTKNSTLENYLAFGSKKDNNWNIGDRIIYPIENFSGMYIEATVIDKESDSILFYGIFQKGYIYGSAKGSIWHFDEGSGSIARDSSGNENHGTVYGASWTAGVSGSALSFDGLDDFVEVQDAYSLDITENITVEAWMNPQELTGGIIENSSFDLSLGYDPNIIHVSGDIFALVYNGANNDGFLHTVEIASDGQIVNPSVDSAEFDVSDGYEPNIIHVSGDIFAIAYRGVDNDGFLHTVEIASNGQIINASVDVVEFDPVECYEPSFIHVSGDIYALVYISQNGLQGNVLTVEIAPNGQIINPLVDELMFENVRCYEPDVIHINGDIYAIAYRGSPSHIGFLKTIEIAADGQITDTIIDGFTFDDKIAYEPDIIHISGSVFSIVYRASPANQGYMTTVRIFSTPAFSGISKTGSYGIFADTTTAFGTINNQTISGPISSGWKHIVLTYNMSDIRLYANGSEIASMPYTAAINTSINDLLFGYLSYGVIDEVAIYDTALSAAEVLNRYNLLKW